MTGADVEDKVQQGVNVKRSIRGSNSITGRIAPVDSRNNIRHVSIKECSPGNYIRTGLNMTNELIFTQILKVER